MQKIFIITFIFLVSLLLLFTLPFYFYVSPAISMSYQVGYSNLHFLIFLFFFIILWYLVFSTVEIGIISNNYNNEVKKNKTFRLIFYIIFFFSILYNFVFSFLALDSLQFWGESSYLIRRIQSANIGMMPYVDFEYLYGPLLLNLPLLLKNYFNLDINTSYLIIFNFFYFVSYLILFKIISNYLKLENKYLIFILFILSTYHISFSLGIPQLYIRSVLTLYFLLLLNNILMKYNKNYLMLALLPGIFFILWSIFPEQALVMIVACAALVLFNKNKINFLIIYTIVLIFLFLLFNNNDLLLSSYRSVVLFSSGARNFPVLFSYFTFSFLLFIFLNILFVSQNFSIKKILKYKFHLESHQSYLIVFILGLLSSPLALGRGDPGHILMGSVGIFLSSFYIIKYLNYLWLRNMIIALYTTYIILITFSYLNVHYKSIALIGLVNLENKLPILNSYINNSNYLNEKITRYYKLEKNNLLNIKKFEQIKQNYQNIKFIPPYDNLYKNYEYSHSYLLDFKMLYSKKLYEEVLKELQNTDYLYLGKDLFCYDQPKYEQNLYNNLSLTFYNINEKNSFSSISEDLCRYISENFKTINQENIDILVRKNK